MVPRSSDCESGIGGERTDQILSRLDTAIENPSAVFLLAGTNDLSFGVHPREIAQQIARIVDSIALRAPECRIFVQSVMPRPSVYAREVLDINARLISMASLRDNVDYIDLWPALASPEASLRPEFTRDGLHLNGRGSEAWVDELRPILSHLKD